MTAHARLSPSSASRWLRCPGSVNFLDALDEGDSGGVAADEGTILHAICEDALRTGTSAYDYVGEVWEYGEAVLKFTEELADQAQEGLDWINTIPGELVIEHRVDLKRWMPGDFGTLDVGIVGKRRIVIWDWKWGFLPVQAVGNDQLRIYALGFWENVARHISDAKDFKLIIFQPRASGGGGEWETTLDELLDFGETLRKKARRTQDPDAPRIPGKPQCDYCEGARTLKCSEYVKFNMELVASDFDDIDRADEIGVAPRLPRTSELTQARKAFLVEHRGMFDKFLDRVHADLLDDAIRGLDTGGLKSVHGRNPARKWKDEEKVKARLVRSLRDDAYTKKLLSPAQAEKTLPPRLWATFADEIDHGEPKIVLVPEEDSRPRVTPIADLFDDD